MSVNISESFHRTSTNPVDDTLTLTKSQMKAINDNVMPNKYFSICQDDGYIYLYDKSNSVDSTLGKFRKFEGGTANAVTQVKIGTTAYNPASGVVSLPAFGTTAGTFAEGNHTHSYAGSDSIGGSANNVKGVTGSIDVARHVWFSDSVTETARNYDDDFKYNPSSNVLSLGALSLAGGRTIGSGDDEGIVVGFASNNWAGVCLGSPSGRRSVFYLNSTAGQNPIWRYNNGTNSYDISHPAKAGTIALTSDIKAFPVTRFHYDGTNDWASYAWHKVAYCTQSAYADYTLKMLVTTGYDNSCGLLTCRGRWNNATPTFDSGSDLVFAVNYGLALANFVMIWKSPNLELWCKVPQQWGGYQFTILDGGYRADNGALAWTLCDSINGHGSASYTSGGTVITAKNGTISNNATSATTAGNVSGIVAIANGGTGASTRLNALKNLTSENVSTSAQYFLTITDNWGKGGYTTIADAKSVLGLKSAAYTESSAYATAGHTHNYAGSNSAGGAANSLLGSYTANGGQQKPNYFGVNKVGALMMNTTVNGNTQYKDWLFMDCYGGSDVGGGVAIGVNRQSLGAYIMRSAAARTSWAESAELIGTHNYTTYCATANHTHSNYLTSVPAASSSTRGGAKIYASGDILYISTT